MARALFGITVKKRNRHPIYAGMQTDGQGNNKIRRIGYKVIETTYDVNPDFPDDAMITAEREVSRKITG